MAVATSQTRIANRALILLGSVERISHVEDGSPLADQIKDLWHESRREIFVLHPWNCLIRRALLNRAGEAPAFGYRAKYRLPAGYLRWLPASSEEADHFDGEEEGGYLLCNADDPQLSIRYIADIESESEWSVHVQILMAYKLALDLCESATQISGNVEAARVRYEDYLAEARRLDGLSTGRRSNDTARVGSRWLAGYVGGRRAPGTWS